jgi:S1-C subfamily serine protease
VHVEPPPATPAKDESTLSGRNPLSGATVVNLSPAAADELGVDPFSVQDGVMVTKIGPGIAAQAGIRPGDVIREVNGRKVRLVSDLRAALAAGGAGGWAITIQRGGQLITAQFRL